MRQAVTPPASTKVIFDQELLPLGTARQPKNRGEKLPQILFISSYPPRECGIATYTQDLMHALHDKFEESFSLKVCALENNNEQHQYPKEVKYVLNTDYPEAFTAAARKINKDEKIEMVVFQHEFGFFHKSEDEFITLLKDIKKTRIVVFHTVLPNANPEFKAHAHAIIDNCDAIIVMTQRSADILMDEYGVREAKISIIPHGTHLVPHADKDKLKEKYGIGNRKVLSTFGLLSSGKSIETTLDALTSVVKTKPDVLFLVIGKTHPGVVKEEGERYREFLEQKVRDLNLENNVRFINKYVDLPELLEYLQLTDIYLFTSKDPNQAVSGTFSYAASCGCAIISTPIPHAKEFLSGDSGIVVDFQNPEQLGNAINKLLFDVTLRNTIKLNALHKIVPTAWENAALAHAVLFESLGTRIRLHHRLPEFNLSHIRKLTTDFGMIQFSKINQPDRESGYTIDDNARAMIAMCQHYELTRREKDLPLIETYLDFVLFCQQGNGWFLNYVDDKHNFTAQNGECNLEDANGRAIWSLGYLISMSELLPPHLRMKAENALEKALAHAEQFTSPRAIAFAIKGLYYYNSENDSRAIRMLIKKLADRLSQMYFAEAAPDWQWFESYLTYANSVLPEAMLMAYIETQEETYGEIAQRTFDFLIGQTFSADNDIKVISNRNWFVRGGTKNHFGEQPIDVAYSILALSQFYLHFHREDYRVKMENAFDWFLGRNYLSQIIYNPCTGGCYDGLEETSVNLNQGAESTVSYLLARLCMERHRLMQRYRKEKTYRLKLENYAFKA
jgi:glycosyltransferase involved in cell wall biosynthesis